MQKLKKMYSLITLTILNPGTAFQFNATGGPFPKPMIATSSFSYELFKQVIRLI